MCVSPSSCFLFLAGEKRLTLERVVDEPLEGGQGTDHEDTGTESGPESTESDLRVDRADRGLGLSGLEGSVQLGDHSVGGVRDDSAEDSGNVTMNGVLCGGQYSISQIVFASREAGLTQR